MLVCNVFICSCITRKGRSTLGKAVNAGIMGVDHGTEHQETMLALTSPKTLMRDSTEPRGGTCKNFDRDARVIFLGLKFMKM